ncbi:hypothetical protein ABID65_006723 [Bradyrhizobium sp. S3.9.2]|uniref:hypothetical protein n=1 Tax=Bradyrhizobium sp. S3.9.2 TaxID=3156432 RepID=UPI00339A1FF9
MKIFTIADVPDDLAHAWLQHLRDFDTANPGCHFQVMADAPTMTLIDIIETIQVHPDLELQAILERKSTGCGGS